MSPHDCHCGGTCPECNESLGYWFLGATDQEYIDRDVAPKNFASRANWLATARDSVAAERITSTGNPSCGAADYQGSPMALTALKDGSIALSIAAGAGAGSSGGLFSTGALAATGAASTAFAAVTFGIGAAVAIFSIIHAHHAAAVAREHSLECALIPSANYALQLIEQAVNSGQMTPAVASKSLDQLYSDFVSKATGGPGGLKWNKCNAMCVFAQILQAIIDKKKDRYAAMAAAAAPQIIAASRPNVTSPAGVPAPASSYASFYGQPGQPQAAPGVTGDWLPVAALFLAGFFFLRSAT
jgi:hypothetical protein